MFFGILYVFDGEHFGPTWVFKKIFIYFINFLFSLPLNQMQYVIMRVSWYLTPSNFIYSLLVIFIHICLETYAWSSVPHISYQYFLL